MKNTLLILAGALVFSSSVSAQINLTTSGYPASLIGTDSLKMTTVASSFPTLSAMTNATWDLSTVSDSTPVFYAYRVPTTTYQFADSNTYAFGAYIYKGNVQTSNTSTGILQYNIKVQPVNYSLTSLTSGPTDSLYIPAQQDTFKNEERIKIGFPATYHSSWSSVYVTNFSYEISVALASLSHAPGITTTYTTEKDSVIGWGKMRVKDATGNPSLYFNVLQVQTIIMATDSFFINGLPAAATLLTALGLTQGQKDTTYQQNYYRMEEVTPLAQVTFKDAAFTQPTSATTHVQRLMASGVPNIPIKAIVKVYPNPVTAQLVNVTLPASGGAWSYELIDINGKTVQNGALQPTGNEAQVILPFSLIDGIYYLKIDNDGKQVSTTPVELAR